MNKFSFILIILSLLLVSCPAPTDGGSDSGDTTAPTVLSVSPGSSETLALDGVITVTFSEAMDESTLIADNITITANSASVICTFAYNANVLTIAPSAALEYGTTYNISLSTAVTDAAGNGLEAVYAFQVTTVSETTPPTVLSVSPGSSETMGIDDNITITFSEAMDESTLISDNITVIGNSAAVSCTFNYGSNVLTITPSSSLEQNTEYTVTIGTSATDLAGNGLASAYVFQVTTATLLTISLPESKYYTTVPSISYTLASGTSNTAVTLNGTAWTGGNETALTDTVTGLNTLVITTETSGGSTVEETVTFFLNDLTVDFSDNFNRADEVTPSANDWFRGYYEGTENVQIISNKLVGTDSNASNAIDSWRHEYAGGTDTECLQYIEVESMPETQDGTLFLLFWSENLFPYTGTDNGYSYPDDYGQIQFRIGSDYDEATSTFNGYDMELSEYDNPSNSTSVIASDEDVDLDFSQPLKMIFYRNGSNYAGIIADTDNNIVSSLSVSNYTRAVSTNFSSLGVCYMPFDTTADGTVLATMDNYAFYK